MNLAKSRGAFTRSNKALRRARHLYCLFIRKHVEKDKTGQRIRLASTRAVEAGLYRGFFNQNGDIANRRDVRWSMMRHFWRLHPEFDFDGGWFRYREAFGWSMDGVNNLPRIKLVRKIA